MTGKCPKCGRMEAQIIADAKTLGLLQEFQSGVYNCCQIVEWADEQCCAWIEAAEGDSRLADNMTGRSQVDGGDSEGRTRSCLLAPTTSPLVQTFLTMFAEIGGDCHAWN